MDAFDVMMPTDTSAEISNVPKGYRIIHTLEERAAREALSGSTSSAVVVLRNLEPFPSRTSIVH